MKTIREGVFETNSSSSHSLTVVMRPPVGERIKCDECQKECTWTGQYEDNGWIIPSQLGITVLCRECIEDLDLSTVEDEVREDLEAIREEGLLDPESQAEEFDEPELRLNHGCKGN